MSELIKREKDLGIILCKDDDDLEKETDERTEDEDGSDLEKAYKALRENKGTD